MRAKLETRSKPIGLFWQLQYHCLMGVLKSTRHPVSSFLFHQVNAAFLKWRVGTSLPKGIIMTRFPRGACTACIEPRDAFSIFWSLQGIREMHRVIKSDILHQETCSSYVGVVWDLENRGLLSCGLSLSLFYPVKILDQSLSATKCHVPNAAERWTGSVSRIPSSRPWVLLCAVLRLHIGSQNSLNEKHQCFLPLQFSLKKKPFLNSLHLPPSLSLSLASFEKTASE